ncbi:NAD(P)/FAD-dependent oxidoreductase [Rhodothermus profundi]|uniref:Sulfide:quinone oxidoreductase n=1 Tax=Rhodothermus profundi TaxID=633813 RepID=A0A1M6RLK2_9BACT|nr:FAD/NAD(P)-binding oxidoreductase [Rhodothermus profundi]SHK33309.1 sulfide:quinone oxidoreductase [Rhodothermus profundi]
MGDRHHEVVIVGGGTAGITVAAQLRRTKNPPEIVIIEPSDRHFYQPLWTLVGAGVFPPEASVRNEADYIPPGATWMQDRVVALDPDHNQLQTAGGQTIRYDYLVLAPGIQLNWGQIPGLKESLGQYGVTSNYAYELAPYTWQVMQQLKPGDRALFTQPSTPVKCGGAPQKIMYLTADHLRRRGIPDQVEVHFFTPGVVIFGIPAFARTLEQVIERYGIQVHFRHELAEVRGPAQQAVFHLKDEQGRVLEERVFPFNMLHVVPPQSAPDFIRNSKVANADGWVDVDPYTLQHVRYPNIFALGDAAGLPTAKTGAAVRKQAPVVVHNLLQLREHGALVAPRKYDGYASCPLVTGYGRLVLAEFVYGNRPVSSFPLDTTKERRSMYLLKKYVLPWLYWNLMLRGKA